MAGARVIERRIGRPASWWGADRELGADRPRWRSAALARELERGEAIVALPRAHCPTFRAYPSQGLQVPEVRLGGWVGVALGNIYGITVFNRPQMLRIV